MATTLLDLSAHPVNLLTPAEWQRFARATGAKSWMGVVRRWAKDRGYAPVWRASDALTIYEWAEGKLRQKTYAPGEWEAE